MKEKFLRQFTEFIFVNDQPQEADVIFIPANGWPQMAERAAELYREGYAPYLLPSGRHSITKGTFSGVRAGANVYSGDYRTEWEFIRDVLMKNGVPQEAILREDGATYTYENALLSRAVTDREGIQVKRGIICCREEHARRCLLYYQLVYPEAQLLICPASTGITRDNWYLSSRGIEKVLSEVERCGTQFHKILHREAGLDCSGMDM